MWEARSQQGPGRCSSLLIVAELGAHRQTAAPDLLHLQLGSHIRVVGQTQRVKLLATRVHQIKVTSTEWTTVHTLSLDGTHQDKLAGQQGKDGLSAHQHGRIHVVQAIKLEDHGTSLEPHTFAGTIVDSSVLLQQLRGQEPEYAQRPCSTSSPFITTGTTRDTIRGTPCPAPLFTPAPGCAASYHLALCPRLSVLHCPLCLCTHCACNVRCKPVPSLLRLPLRARSLGTCVAVALTFSCFLVALFLPPLVVLAHCTKHYA